MEASQSPEGPIGLYRALRRFSGVQETLYPLAPVFEPVSRWFLEPARRGDDALVARLRAAALRDDEAKVGVLHASNERADRGGFSLYVPEAWEGGPAGTEGRPSRSSWRSTEATATAGISCGRGSARRARAGMLLLSPTSLDRTWSMMGPDVDAEPLREMVESVAARYAVDRERVLLTGMSDGATYALYCGLRESMPFTHLRPPAACSIRRSSPPAISSGRAAGRST